MLRPSRKLPGASDRYSSRRRPRALSPSKRHRLALALEPLESRRLLATLTVNTTSDAVGPTDPTLSLREAIEVSNGTLAISALSTQAQAQISGALGTPNSIHFAIPASTAPNLDVPVAGFDPNTQTWTITPDGTLPTITTPVDIDGFTEANVGMPYAYPNEIASSSPPTEITTVPNSTAAINGNNARVRVIIDGSASGGGTGFILDASYSMLRGLIIANFAVGVSIPNPTDVGNSIQGDFVGDYFLHPVNPNSGLPLPAPEGEVLVTAGSSQQGVIINGANSTLGGASPQDDVVITGSGSQGVWIQSGALGTQVLGCQIGVIGPSDFGVYYSVGNGAQGVLVQSSSDLIGAVGAGNLIGANAGDGVQLDQAATQVQIAGELYRRGAGRRLRLRKPAPRQWRAMALTSSGPRTTPWVAARPPPATRSRSTGPTASTSPAPRRPATSCRIT